MILVVDDEPEIRDLFFRHLDKRGYTVYLAGSIEEEKRVLEIKTPDLIFLDINLPDGNGLEELKRLKPIPSTFKVVLMSAFDHLEERKLAFDWGAIDFLSKPFSLSRLNQVLDLSFNLLNKPIKGNGKYSGN